MLKVHSPVHINHSCPNAKQKVYPMTVQCPTERDSSSMMLLPIKLSNSTLYRIQRRSCNHGFKVYMKHGRNPQL